MTFKNSTFSSLHLKTFTLSLFALSSIGCMQNASLETTVSDAPLQYVSTSEDNPLTQEGQKKIKRLEELMKSAEKDGIDVVREETVLWFAKEFLKFADWDQANPEAVEYMFAQYGPYKDKSGNYSERLPDFEREKVIRILNGGIETLTKVMNGEITRRPVAKVDWENIVVSEDALLSKGKPTFLYDYFSKSVGRPLTDTQVYNDHLGAIYHGGQRLYDVNKDRAVNSYLLNEDGSFDQERLSYISEIPDTNVGFLILWNMGIPEWAAAKEPEIAKGRSLFTGYDIDNPLARDIWSKIIRKAGEMTRGKKVTQLGYILSNEPHWYSEAGHWSGRFGEMTEISSYTLTKFHTWLDHKYDGDIAALNSNWGTQFGDFDSVAIKIPIDPTTRGTPIWYDWSRYNMDRSIDWFTYLQGELLKTNPDANTHLKIMPNMFTEDNRSHGIDVEALTELTTMIGDDAKTRANRHLNYKKPEKWEEHYAYFWEELSVSYDFMESVSPEKIHINSEAHFLSASWSRELDLSPDYVRSVFWLATIQGMDAAISWFWARDPDGSPEDRLEGELNFFDPALAGSFAGSVNQQPHIANAKTQVMFDLNSFSDEVMAIRKQRRPLRLFHSETSAINKKFHMSEQFKLYESLFFEGFPLGYATEGIINKQDHDNWDAIVVYKTEFITDGEFDALQSYLDGGGTIIIDNAKSLSMNEYWKPRASKLRAGNGKLINVGGQASLQAIADASLSEVRGSLADLTLTEDNGTNHKGVLWRVVEAKDGGHLVNVLNLGKNSATVKLSSKDKSALVVNDMMTGQTLGDEFEVKPNGVFLLNVKQ